MGKTDHQEFEAASSKNADRISGELNSLKNGHWAGFGERDYKSFFAHAKEIVELFKTLRPLKKSDRESLWNEYQQICDQVRSRQNEEWRSRQARSKSEKEVCLRFIRDATYSARGARDRNEVQNARMAIDEAHSQLRDRSRNMLKDDTQECWEAFRAAKTALHFRIKELQDVAYYEAQKAVSDARNALSYQSNPFDALKDYQEAQARAKGLHLSKDQFRWIKSEFDSIWQGIQAKIEEYKRERQRQYEEKARKHQEWLNRQYENLQRWEDRIDKLEGIIQRLESQISDLEDQRSNARTDEFADRCAGWINEKRNVIADMEATIRELERKISDVKSKIR